MKGDAIKVIGVVGSPRVGGNTEDLTKVALEEIEREGIQTELIRLSGKKIQPCDGCGSCLIRGECHIKDDFYPIFEKIVAADGLILATPVYYGAATPQMASFISRFYCHEDTAGKKPLKHKVGGPIVVAYRAGHNFTLAQLLFFFMINGMIVPGSKYWNVAFGSKKGEALKDEEGVDTIRDFGKSMAWLIKKIK